MINNQNIAILSEKVAALEAAIKNAGIELPSVTADDNGKTLQVVAGKWDKGMIIPELPAVTSGDNGKALQVIAGAWATGGKIPEIIHETITGTITNGVLATGKLVANYMYLGNTLTKSYLVSPINALSDGTIKLLFETAQREVVSDEAISLEVYFLKLN